MLDHFSPAVLVWAFTYVVHSSALIVFAYLLDRAGLLKKTRNAELVWRFALFGGLLTASAQLYLGSTNEAIENRPVLQASEIAHLGYPLPENLPISKTLIKPENNAVTPQIQTRELLSNHDTSRKPATVEIELPGKVQEITSYFVLVWAMIAIFACLITYRSARYLNRLAAYFPDADKSTLKHIMNRMSDRDQTRIQLKVSEQWNSPFVTPDNTICIPRWAFTKLTEDQRDAMLAHEVAHVLRRDPAWRVAMQLLARICFFQVLNRLAIHKLELLAELACDENAANTSGKPHELAEALYACARVFKAKEAPSLALAMSRQGSPLLKRITSLLDTELLAQAAIPQSKSALAVKYSLLSVGLLAVVFSTPSIIVSFEKITPQLQAAVSKVSHFAREVTIAANLRTADKPIHQVSANAITPRTELLVKENLTATSENSHSLSNTVSFEPTDKTNLDDLNEANRLRIRKDFSRATSMYQMLAEKGSVEAQQALGEMYWFGSGVPSNPKLAEEWFKKASANGSLNADKFLAVLAEREKHQNEIQFFTNEYDGRGLKFVEMNCNRPDFSTAAHNSVDIENMINHINEFASCFNQYGERLNASKDLERVIPNEVLRLMTDEEVEKAINRSTRALATIRLTANMIADDFTMEKRTWETRTREYFKGARSRDWVSLKRVALIGGVDPELALMHDPQLVKINTETRLNMKLPAY